MREQECRVGASTLFHSVILGIHWVPLCIKNLIATGLRRKISILNLQKHSVFQLFSNSLLHKDFITSFCFVFFQEEKEVTSKFSNFSIREMNVLAYKPSYSPTQGASEGCITLETAF